MYPIQNETHLLEGSILAFCLVILALTVDSWRKSGFAKIEKSALYSDQDGTATPETQARYSARLQSISLPIVLTAAFAFSLSNAIEGTRHNSPTTTSLWLLFAIKAVILLLGLYTAFLLPLFLSCNFTKELDCRTGTMTLTSLAKETLQVSSCHLFAAAVATSIPRRPDIFVDGHWVDRLWGASLWSLVSFSCCNKLIDLARYKRDATKDEKLEYKDLGILDNGLRAHVCYDYLRSLNSEWSLFRKLVWAVRWQLTYTSCFALAEAFFSIAPQFCLFQLIKTLQQRDEGKSVSAMGFFWLLTLAASQLAYTSANSFEWLYADNYLMIPIQLHVQALIFAKSIAKKNVQGADPDESPDEEELNTLPRSSTVPDTLPNEDDFAETSALLDHAASDTDPAVDQDTAKGKPTSETVINLMTVDAGRLAQFANIFHMSINCLGKLTFAVYALWQILGWQAVVVSVAVQLLCLPVNVICTRRYYKIQKKLMKARDAKLALLREVICGIMQIKFTAMEEQWQDRIMKVRGRELAHLWRAFKTDLFLIAFWMGYPLVLSASSLVTHALIYHSLDPATAFGSFAITGRMKNALANLPQFFTIGGNALNSLRRITEYLETGEKTKISVDSERIAFQHAAVAWPVEGEKVDPNDFILSNVTLDFPVGELSVISGGTGSGKSLLLAALLGECELIHGSILMPPEPPAELRCDHLAHKGNWLLPNARAYVSQNPWIENCSLKQNILFGLPFDKARYAQVIEACALTKDVKRLLNGDETEIGPNGANLSGGQRWRLTLARALYSRAGILILDDIFSAVDTHVGKHIYENALTGPISQGRTRILVSHHVNLCKPAISYEIHLADGEVEYANRLTPSRVATGPSDATVEDDTLEGTDLGAERPVDQWDHQPAEEVEKFVKEEGRQTGRITLHAYKSWFKNAGSSRFWIMVLCLFIAYEFAAFAPKWVIRNWTRGANESTLDTPTVAVWPPVKSLFTYLGTLTIFVPEENAASTDQFSSGYIGANVASIPNRYSISNGVKLKSFYFYLTLWVSLCSLEIIIGPLRFYAMFIGSLQASRKLYEKMTWAVLRATPDWLNRNPEGRLINRFVTDAEKMDTRLADSLTGVGWHIGMLIAMMIFSIMITPYLVISIALLGCVGAYFAWYYYPFAMDMTRLESVNKSPINDYYSAALQGMCTIRGFGMVDRYLKGMFDKLDGHARPSYYLYMARKWLAWRMGVVGCLFSGSAIFFVLVNPGIDAALAGFVLSCLLNFNDFCYWFYHYIVEMELNMNATERIVEYVDLEEVEDQGGSLVPPSWPTEGRLEVRDVSASYRPGDAKMALQELNFNIEPRERIGIVGRTGAGKSTFTRLLWNLVHVQEGSIMIDDVDISGIKLHDLRSRLTIIPQDPVLFTGTIRSNLDPFNAVTDEELHEALRRVHLTSESRHGGTASSVPSDSRQGSTDSSVSDAASVAGSIPLGAEGASQSTTIAPQDPVLFTGTYQTNLDPFHKIPDDEALYRIQQAGDSRLGSTDSTNTTGGSISGLVPGLGATGCISEGSVSSSGRSSSSSNRNMFQSLSSKIARGGDNLSQGQRQLLCMARAIVSRPKIMVLDEATSAVDKKTDVLIQRTIRKDFGDATLLVVAHRLTTVADFDRVLVLEEGRAVEFDAPKELMKIEGGVFRQMVHESTEREDLLRLLAP